MVVPPNPQKKENCFPPLTPPGGRTKKELKLKIILMMLLNEIK